MQQANSAKPAQRLATKYRFDDEDMDLFFVAALGWGPAGGLDVGQTFHVASQITDGDGESWVRAFAGQGELLDVQADDWLARGARPDAKPPTAATLRSRETMFWKVGARNVDELLAHTSGMKADPARVTVPFLSILGSGDSPVFAAQAHA